MTIVKNRKLALCLTLEDWPVEDLLEVCPKCDDFFMPCCACGKNGRSGKRNCHHYRIVFTDGACINNGRPDAIAGAGVAYGKNECSQRAIPITDEEDLFPVRSNQRAELYAARMGLDFIAESARLNSLSAPTSSRTWIIATDSEYVVKGITEWFPAWKRNGWRTSKGTIPVNLDLFIELDNALSVSEIMGNEIGFWHIPRVHNQLADRLAKSAARNGTVATSQGPDPPEQVRGIERKTDVEHFNRKAAI